MRLPEIKHRRFRQDVSVPAVADVFNPNAEEDLDSTAWELIANWKQHHGDRHGAGTSSPFIPDSQRQYDGDNHFDYCEVLVLH